MQKKDKIALITSLIVISMVFYYFLFPNRNWLGVPYLQTTKNQGFAVVELFTSEGCSSCPPADALMAKIQKEANGKDIYFLAFHVDYWNHLNWKDSFSDAQFTNRQQQYADWMGQNVLYTPQFVINGASEFGGDDTRTLYNQISNALQMSPNTVLALHTQSKGDSLKVEYKTDAEIKNTDLFIATVLKEADTKVKRGENGGRLLHHVQIVRQANSIALSKKDGHLVIAKPKDFNTKNWEIIGFIQKKATGSINAASKAQLD
ncbi:DUF1223 domain-containing protein [Flavobacterium sp.]|uniref:DUF1223 domain-containing protein n=1 Tax=Flavobacterium sp. TaxID=239 RepID=UPI003D6AEE3D